GSAPRAGDGVSVAGGIARETDLRTGPGAVRSKKTVRIPREVCTVRSSSQLPSGQLVSLAVLKGPSTPAVEQASHSCLHWISAAVRCKAGSKETQSHDVRLSRACARTGPRPGGSPIRPAHLRADARDPRSSRGPRHSRRRTDGRRQDRRLHAAHPAQAHGGGGPAEGAPRPGADAHT